MEAGSSSEALDASDATFSSTTTSPKAVKSGKRRRKATADKNSCSESATRDNSCKFHKFEWTDKILECPVYHPSEQEFEDPLAYLQKIAPVASKYGICKIISPINASVPAAAVLKKELKDFKFKTNVQPLRLSEWNEHDKTTFLMGGRKYTYREFETVANKAFLSRFCSSGGLPSAYVEKEFWHEIAHGQKGTVEYGVNVEGSAFSCDPEDKLGKSKWNLKNFSRQLKSTLRLIDGEIPGITDPMLYIGMLFSMFAWHVEDHYLYSINYHHSGANKTWYGVPGHAASQFEKVVLDHVYHNKIVSEQGEDGAFEILAQKTTIFPPNVLLQHDVPVYKAVQKPGEFVITFPSAYHAGFSHGFNCGEAVNFAISDWFPLGAAASKRYAHLRMLPVIPYEELLCKEAMLVYKSSEVRGSKNKCVDLASHSAIVLSFMHLVRFYKQAISQLNSPRQLSSSSNSLGNLICSHCHRDCYIAYIMCKRCCSHPICLFHAIESESQDCFCGNVYTIFKRDDMLAMEDAAASFEQQKDKLETRGEMNMCQTDENLFFYTRNEHIQDHELHNCCQEAAATREVGGVKLKVGKTNITVMKHCRKRGRPPTQRVTGDERELTDCKLRKKQPKLLLSTSTIC